MTFIVDICAHERAIYKLFQGHQYVISDAIDDEGKWTFLHEVYLFNVLPVLMTFLCLNESVI